MLRKQFLETSRGRLAALLQRGGMTVDDLASALGLTANAVRAQLTAMERDGLVRRAGQVRGATRPSHVFELTGEVEQLLSRAYIPLLTHLVRVFAQGLRRDQVNKLMQQAGKSLASEFPIGNRPSGNLQARVRAASALLNNQLGAVTRVVRHNGRFVIRGTGCPLAAITDKHPSVCLAIESLVKEIVGAPVHECCDRSGRPRCCFEVTANEAH